ncbi:hypothetical protein O6H91_16G012300 [Diphasiastrum complanatum]|uniref:Uncharacterized protein n=1 Tax=Diphasiastrum complanatum TaxID=34168 RepID=A0ACC2BA38_DIPCM|nr:hypothetical protein O6H91_16G012300 [Diphasiastrum complanatum]
MEFSSLYSSVEEQHEKLRRFVDEWSGQVSETLAQLSENALGFANNDCGDINRDAIHMLVEARDSTSVLNLINTDNVPFNKVMIVLSNVCSELQILSDRAFQNVYPQLLVFGLHASPDKVPSEGELQLSFSRSFPFFIEVIDILSRLRATLQNLTLQLQGLYGQVSKNKGPSSCFSVTFHTAISSMAKGLSILITLDGIVGQNGAIAHSLSLFIRMLQSLRNDPSKFGMKLEQVESLDWVVSQLDETLKGGLFQRCLYEDFYSNPEMAKLKTDQSCLNKISSGFKGVLLQLLSRLDSTKERPMDREILPGLLGVFVFHSWMSGEAPSKKVSKVILKVITYSPILHTFCNIRLNSFEFLSAHLPPWVLASVFYKEARKEARVLNHAYLAGLHDVLTRDAQALNIAVANWLVSFNSVISPTVQQLAVHVHLGTRLNQFLQGIELANRLHHILTATIDLHLILEVPINKDQICQLRKAAEILKAVQGMYHRRGNETAQSISHILQYLQAQMQGYLHPLKLQLEENLSARSKNSSLVHFSRSLTRSGKETNLNLLDSMAAVNLSLTMLEGCPSLQRRLILHLALDVVKDIALQKGKQEEVVEEVKNLCFLMDMVAELDFLVKKVTDCSFLYWSREIMPTCFSMVYSEGDEAPHLQLLVNAFKDGVQLLAAGNVDSEVIKCFEKEIEDALINEIVMPLCRDIETDLRLHVHSANLKGTVNVNPTKTGIRDLSWFLHLKPLRLTSKYIHIKNRVETYLNATFYDHAAVALHNWKGVDVLEIMRNIHTFVACFTYNLNTQVFIERFSNSVTRKHVNTLTVKHVANSIRTHGIGIMSTTVNFTYQYLAKQFVAFSQFLFDDHIKSRLMKERRFYKENKGKIDNGYPVARAERLNKDIKKLGLTEGLSFLDQFRRLIAEMGNALGFVRMVRLGGLHHGSTVSGFIKDSGVTNKFEETLRRLRMSSDAIESGKLFDRVVESLNMSSDQTDYFIILTNVFSKELQNTDNLHLQEFFLIIPALTINAAEAMFQAKEKLMKRGRDITDALFTDDGFVLGLAYLLKVLEQEKHFDSLHWFQTVRSHFTAEKSRLEQGVQIDSNGSSMNKLRSQKLGQEEVRNMQLKIKRVTGLLTELELMDFTLNGARVFFL